MAKIHHKQIKKFTLDGQIYDESTTPRLKTEYIKLIVSQMKISGYVPRLDIDPDFTIEYDEKKQIFNFKLSIYGIYVGKRNSECIIGMDGLTVIPIAKNKSNEFSQEQV